MTYDKLIFKRGSAFRCDAIEFMNGYVGEKFQAVIADPPYYNVLLTQEWDTCWKSEADYLEWTKQWVLACAKNLRDDGLLFVFGQIGKREHVWIHLCSMLCKQLQFHDLIVWDRVVGYNDRQDSFTPQYENVLVLRKTAESNVYFDKDAVRIPYDESTIVKYMKDKRYKDVGERERHLRAGKYATNILKVPSLKGSSNEKIGHPSQKPFDLIQMLVKASTKKGDLVFDPFLGSGTTAAVCEKLERLWIGTEIEPEYLKIIERRLSAQDTETALDLFESSWG